MRSRRETCWAPRRGAALIAADPRLRAQTRLAVSAVSHDADVDEVRERRHERIDARVAASVVEDARAHIRAAHGVERILEAEPLVAHDVSHVIPPCEASR